MSSCRIIRLCTNYLRHVTVTALSLRTLVGWAKALGTIVDHATAVVAPCPRGCGQHSRRARGQGALTNRWSMCRVHGLRAIARRRRALDAPLWPTLLSL